MEKNNFLAATADLQVVLNNELGNTIKKSVLFYIDGRDPYGMVSSFEREMIAEDAWFHVVEKRELYNATKDAKFRTWAQKVAKNFASDQLAKLSNDPLHHTGTLHEDQPKKENDAKEYNDNVSYRRAFGSVADCSDRLDWKNALEALEGIVSNYSGRDRTVGEMLIAQKSKEEIMAETQMSGGNVDVCKSRVIKKMRADLLQAGYSLAA